jgi:hypothetical protein
MWVRLDPLPADSGGQGSADGEVDVPDRRRGERPAYVRLALDHLAAHLRAVMVPVTALRRSTYRVSVSDDAALVLASDDVVDPGPAVAAETAAA